MENIQVRDLRNGDWYYIHKIVYEEYGQVIGAIGLALYNALCYYANTQSGKCYPSLKTISKKLNISEVCIGFYLKKLKKQKLIKIKSGKATGSVNLYYILKIKSNKQGSNYVITPNKHVTRGNNYVTTNKNKITRIINNTVKRFSSYPKNFKEDTFKLIYGK